MTVSSPAALDVEVLASGGEEKVKPRLRGVFHMFGFFASLGAFFFLAIAPASGPRHTAGLVYGASLLLMFGLSALYHRPTWGKGMRRVLRRLDHAGIYGLIAGTFTPIALLESRGTPGLALYLMWAGAIAGATVVALWTDAHRGVRAGMNVALGLGAAPVIFSLPQVLGPLRFWLLMSGCAIYILGAVVYARRWPNPNPRVLGYHEVFHLMVVAAAALHFAVVVDVQWKV